MPGITDDERAELERSLGHEPAVAVEKLIEKRVAEALAAQARDDPVRKVSQAVSRLIGWVTGVIRDATATAAGWAVIGAAVTVCLIATWAVIYGPTRGFEAAGLSEAAAFALTLGILFALCVVGGLVWGWRQGARERPTPPDE